MPIYEYCCEDCRQIFEEWQKDFQDRDKICPVCGGTSQRLISNTSFVLKGGGWYASGYSKDSGGNGKKDTSSAPSPDTSSSAS
jgi:putative FmdB family regulatory protein